VGQGALGIESRAGDDRIAAICQRLNHPETFFAVTAERAFLKALGGGCQSPVGAHATVSGDRVTLRAVAFRAGAGRRGEGSRPVAEAALLGEQVAAGLK
jgi:hydroxymethylbilane synthase